MDILGDMMMNQIASQVYHVIVSSPWPFNYVLEALTWTSPLTAAPLLSFLSGARLPTKERPLTGPLSLLDAPTASLTAAAPRAPWLPTTIN